MYIFLSLSAEAGISIRMVSRPPRAAAMRSSVDTEGFAVPRSILEMSDWSMPVSVESSFWDIPTDALADATAREEALWS